MWPWTSYWLSQIGLHYLHDRVGECGFTRLYEEKINVCEVLGTVLCINCLTKLVTISSRCGVVFCISASTFLYPLDFFLFSKEFMMRKNKEMI